VNPSGKTQRSIPVTTIEKVVEMRLQELFTVIHDDLARHGVLDRIGAGVMLAGGGARLPGIEKLANTTLSMPARVARPSLVSGEETVLRGPQYLTALGLLRFGKLSMDIGEAEQNASVGDDVRSEARKLWNTIRRSLQW